MPVLQVTHLHVAKMKSTVKNYPEGMPSAKKKRLVFYFFGELGKKNYFRLNETIESKKRRPVGTQENSTSSIINTF